MLNVLLKLASIQNTFWTLVENLVTLFAFVNPDMQNYISFLPAHKMPSFSNPTQQPVATVLTGELATMSALVMFCPEASLSHVHVQSASFRPTHFASMK